MKEIGGYIELDTYTGAMLHEKAIALNCGRGALEYLCEAKMIRKLYLPYFLCDSVPNLGKKSMSNMNFTISIGHLNRFLRRRLAQTNGSILSTSMVSLVTSI